MGTFWYILLEEVSQMSKTRKFLLSIPAMSMLGMCSIVVASPASAFTFGTGSVGISASDIGNSFQVVFDGSVESTAVPGLSSIATITFLGFQSIKGNTLANLQVSLSNTSTAGVTSRTSAFGFDIDRTLLAASSSGLFTNSVLNGSLPNEFGDLDVCFTIGGTCQGGRSGGVTTGNTSSFSPTLTLAGSVSTFTLSNFGVRYQSITGVRQGTSGTGEGTPVAPPPVTPPPVLPPVDPPPVVPPVVTPPVVEIPPVTTPPVEPPVVETPPVELPVVEPPKAPTKSVPEPGLVGALVLTSLAAFRSRKRQEVSQ